MAKNNFTDYAGYCDYYTSNDFIAHFGILGMKWGVRRYQNPDGSLTAAGQKRYNGSDTGKTIRDVYKDTKKVNKYHIKNAKGKLVKTKNEYHDYTEGSKVLNNNKKVLNSAHKVKDILQKQNEAESERREKLKELQQDDKRFNKVVDDFIDSTYSKEDVELIGGKDKVRDWMLNGDGWQDAAEDWYIEKYEPETHKKLQDAYSNSQEVRDQIRGITTELLGNVSDLNSADKVRLEQYTDSLLKDMANSIYKEEEKLGKLDPHKNDLKDYINMSSKRKLNEKEHHEMMNKLDQEVSGIAKKPKYSDFKNGKLNERAKRNIELGLKALKLKDSSWIDDFDGGIKNKDLQSWWLYEDQTIGGWQIADMVNKGWSKSKILNTIDNIKKGYSAIDYGYDASGWNKIYDNPTVWELSETWNVGQLVDDMIKAKN